MQDLPDGSTGKHARNLKYSGKDRMAPEIWPRLPEVTKLPLYFRTKTGRIGDLRARNAADVSRPKAK